MGFYIRATLFDFLASYLVAKLVVILRLILYFRPYFYVNF